MIYTENFSGYTIVMMYDSSGWAFIFRLIKEKAVFAKHREKLRLVLIKL